MDDSSQLKLKLARVEFTLEKSIDRCKALTCERDLANYNYTSLLDQLKKQDQVQVQANSTATATTNTNPANTAATTTNKDNASLTTTNDNATAATTANDNATAPTTNDDYAAGVTNRQFVCDQCSAIIKSCI